LVDTQHDHPELPPSLDPIIGRAAESAEIASLLPTARLITLTGVGGSGKTRLALHIASLMRDTFPDGVRWVDLSLLADPALVPNLVASACGIDDPHHLAISEALVAALRNAHMLVVLDNCEHLLEACAHELQNVLGACPQLHALVTSREALAIPGEVIWLVKPLSAPASDAAPDVEDALTYEAVQLFIARASAARPGFRLTPANVASVARICDRLGGLPLAVELAAARVRVLAVEELAERLEQAERLPAAGYRTAHPRQQTLQATFDWSYGLLTNAERAVFDRLAVFAGGFSLRAAEEVCRDENLTAEQVFAALLRLVEQSLVTAQNEQPSTRFHLLEPLRQYAQQHLNESGALETAHRRHRDWCAHLAAEAANKLAGPEQGVWLDRLAAEYDNLRQAFVWSLAVNEPIAAGQLASNIWQFWLARGRIAEGRHWLEQLLTALPGATPLRAQLLWIAGILARPDAARGRRWLDESLRLWQELENAEGIALVSSTIGFLAQSHGDHAQAISAFEASLTYFRSSGDLPGLARVLTNLALSLLEAGESERALSLCQESLSLQRQVSDLRGEAVALANLGLVWNVRGDSVRATALWEESLGLRRSIGDHGGAAHVLTLLGHVAVAQARFPQAALLLREALELRRHLATGDGVAPILDALAAIGAARDDLLHATQLASAADALRATTGLPLASWERAIPARTLATLRARQSSKAFARAWAMGQAWSIEQAIEAAMTQLHSPPIVDTVTGDGDAALELATAAPTRVYDLTPREIDVLRLVTLGLTYAQIGEALGMSPRTVDAHMRAIFSKLDVRSRSAATRLALLYHLV
jgi:non-specific serine/threonine protein kinase